jgi:hypothetical protein
MFILLINTMTSKWDRLVLFIHLNHH